MGNCLVLEEKVIKVVKPDGKVLEYRSPIKTFEVLSEFSGHALSAETTTSGSVLLNQHHLKPETRLLGGHLYYLVPVPLPAKKKTMKKVRFTEPEKEEEKKPEQETTAKINSSSSKVVRIKLVISKQELQELLKGTGGGSVLTVDDMVSKLHSDKKIKLDGSDDCDRFNLDDGDDDYDFQREGCNWKPVLESIPELN
ncbi:uncharacterized protein LOC133823932 [Humulus lupulus]|uniref:uncharacterized protein LOC133823932 n=1 Tax=Humulus lupulus TaxID=3486 RepID=UPI002B40319D|nr:uncharacterized protein LOC133823932 [Humulus lupulus]